MSIIGFPFGTTAGAGYLGVWIKGWVASETTVEWQDLPCFLVDARTRRGSSGSPVVNYIPVGQIFKRGIGEEQQSFIPRVAISELVGIFSGRINDDADLGFVWTNHAIRDVIQNGQRANDGMTFFRKHFPWSY